MKSNFRQIFMILNIDIHIEKYNMLTFINQTVSLLYNRLNLFFNNQISFKLLYPY